MTILALSNSSSSIRIFSGSVAAKALASRSKGKQPQLVFRTESPLQKLPQNAVSLQTSPEKKHPASENYLKLLENPWKLFFAPFKRTPLQNSSKLPIFLGSEKSTKEPADHKALHQNLGEEAPGKIPICSRFVPVWMGETWWNWIPMGFFLAKLNLFGIYLKICIYIYIHI